MKVVIIDRDLFSQRLEQKMRDKGFAHKNGSPHQKELAIAIGKPEKQSMISAYLRMDSASIPSELLTAIAKQLNCQEQWLIGGEYVPLQERPLFVENEEIYSPEAKEPEKGKNELLSALWAIERQLEKLNDKLFKEEK